MSARKSTVRQSAPAATGAAGGNLYDHIAKRVADQVGKGIYRAGERVPSVRRLSIQFGVSVSTVIEAYRRLENKGVIEARPQSGYYVRRLQWRPPAQPEISRPSSVPTAVSVNDLAMRVLKATRRDDLVQLAVAVPHADFLPVQRLDRIVAAVGRRHDSRIHQYDYPPGLPELRQQIARRALEAGCELAPDDILTTNGCQEALSLCLRAVAKPGDTIAIESPAFYGSLQVIETLGMKALEIPTHPREGVSLDALRLALERWSVRACLFVTNFSNPLGSCMPEDNKRRLVKLLAEHDVPLIEDDVYGDLAFDNSRPKAAKAFDRDGNVLLCSSFSKTLAPGFRVGWVTPGRYQAVMEHLKYVGTLATPTLPQIVIAEFLAHGGYDRHLRHMRTSCARQAERMTQAIARFFPPSTRVTQPAGGLVLWVELAPGVDSLELHRRALERGISIAPGPLFSAKQKYRNCIRLTCALPWSERIEQALVVLGRLAEDLA